jgi:hypothetical protein
MSPKEKSRIERLLKLYDEATKDKNIPAERALWHLLNRWKDKLPELDERFHKNFRQCDVTDDGSTDMAIWQLLYAARIFWDIFEQVQDENPTKKDK